MRYLIIVSFVVIFFVSVVLLEELKYGSISGPEHLTDEERKYYGDGCRRHCDKAQSHASGICAALSAFGAPIVCFLSGFGGLACAMVEGVLWGLGSYCTTGAWSRFCEKCTEGISFSDLYDRQIEINERLLSLSQIFNESKQVRRSAFEYQSDWDGLKHAVDVRIRYEANFQDIDHVLYLMYQMDENSDSDTNDFLMSKFNETVFSPGRSGIINLINQLHRLLNGDGVGLYYQTKGSLFEVEPKFCQLEYLRQFEHAQFNLFNAFFLAAKYNQLDENEIEKFQNVFASRRRKQVQKIRKICHITNWKNTTQSSDLN